MSYHKRLLRRELPAGILSTKDALDDGNAYGNWLYAQLQFCPLDLRAMLVNTLLEAWLLMPAPPDSTMRNLARMPAKQNPHGHCGGPCGFETAGRDY